MTTRAPLRPVNEAQIELDLELINRVSRLGWQHDLHNLEALIERLRVEMIVKEYRGSAKHFQRAVIDRLEDVLEERYENENADRETTRTAVLSYIRSLWESLDPKE